MLNMFELILFNKREFWLDHAHWKTALAEGFKQFDKAQGYQIIVSILTKCTAIHFIVTGLNILE